MTAGEWQIMGYWEAVIGVADPEPWCALLQELGGWQQHEQADGSRVLAMDGLATGAVRLEPVSGAPNRPGAITRDSGGLFDIDLRVADLLAMVPAIEALGWKGLSEPIDWRFGEMDVREWLAQGPDGVVIAFMQRLRPPLPKPPGPGFSHAFNASQIVRDMEAALEWYGALGFSEMVRHQGPLPGRGGEVLGLTSAEAPETPVDLVILSTTGEVDGSIELVSFPDHPGADLAAQCHPGGRGLSRMRFPVRGLKALQQHLATLGWPLEDLNNGDLRLYSPDNACLECFEA